MSESFPQLEKSSNTGLVQGWTPEEKFQYKYEQLVMRLRFFLQGYCNWAYKVTWSGRFFIATSGGTG